MIPEKIDLGDGVDAEIDEYGIISLTTSNKYWPFRTIFLKPEVMAKLQMFYERKTKEEAAANQPATGGTPT